MIKKKEPKERREKVKEEGTREGGRKNERQIWEGWVKALESNEFHVRGNF